jgi:uncharacterized membrane protein affecting hemolysin expression
MNPIIFLLSIVVVIVSLVYLFAYGIPNLQRANEEVRLAQIEVDKSQAELNAAMDEVNQSVEEILNQ